MYSVWTNSSFKAPLIASGIACLAGNFLYCLGYDFQSFWILLLARLVTGFGELNAQLRCFQCSVGELRSKLQFAARPKFGRPSTTHGVLCLLRCQSSMVRGAV